MKDEHIESKNIIWQWKPETKPYDLDDLHRHDDIAEEYVIEMVESADSGIVLWGKFRGDWVIPWSARPVITKLLNESGKNITVPKRVNRKI